MANRVRTEADRAADRERKRLARHGSAPPAPVSQSTVADPLDPVVQHLIDLLRERERTIVRKDLLIEKLVERNAELMADICRTFVGQNPDNAGQNLSDNASAMGLDAAMTRSVAPPLRAPARARPSESYSLHTLSLSQDHKHPAEERFQDCNGARTSADAVPDNGGQNPDNAGQNVGHESDTKRVRNGSTTVQSFEVSEGGEAEREGDPWGLNGVIARPPLSIVLSDPPMSDERHRAKAAEDTRRLAEQQAEWDREDRERQSGSKT
jgi:hypothetical protein